VSPGAAPICLVHPGYISSWNLKETNAGDQARHRPFSEGWEELLPACFLQNLRSGHIFRANSSKVVYRTATPSVEFVESALRSCRNNFSVVGNA